MAQTKGGEGMFANAAGVILAWVILDRFDDTVTRLLMLIPIGVLAVFWKWFRTKYRAASLVSELEAVSRKKDSADMDNLVRLLVHMYLLN
jgi:hypothetical protein